ncbi:MAG: inositol-3-phosphate synthase [Candidatus Odinarchaeota archaeon]|nr:inositol-3-phosphate synthase [Candidatus Odinarchaeota archaeon]
MARKAKVAIAGVGNCASALIQGVFFYKENPEAPGLMHYDFGGYKPEDIEFVAAFDVNKKKIGKDLSEAIWVKPNCCAKFYDVPKVGVEVLPAPLLDGVAPHTKDTFLAYDQNEVKPTDIVDVLKESDADMLINYLPVGSYKGSRFYANACLESGVSFINAIPEFIVSDEAWAKKFEDKGIPIAGDDVKSQLGATIVNRVLASLFRDRGVKILDNYQLNIGGNTDFLNMTVEERLRTKRISKTEAVTSLIPYELKTRIGPSDYVPFLRDKKVCYIHMSGLNFGSLKLTLDLKLVVEDSPNSGGVMLDVIRAVKIARDRGVGGPLISISAYSFKHPPVQVDDAIAKTWVEEFIEGKREK